jgi:probable phosphoglycerate mutase
MTVSVMHLVRHGRTAWHRPNRYAGRSDIDLDDTGAAQARELAGWAARARLAAIATSPLRRAVHTAAPAAAATGLAPVVDPRLRELDFGVAEGRTLDEVRAADPEVAARFVADPAGCPFPGGEAPADAVARARATFDELADRYSGEAVLVVAHNTLIRLVVCAVLGIPLSEYRRILPRLDPVTRTTLRFAGGPVGMLAYNAPLDPGCAV